MNKEKYMVLVNFLKNGLSSRQIDVLLGYDKNKTRGWKSWTILKEYKLSKEDKGKLFLYNSVEYREIISKLKEIKLDILIKNKVPSIIKKYEDAIVLAKSEENFYQIMSGETRNIMKRIFGSLKKSIPYCQFKNCKGTELETAHLHTNRPEIFKLCAKRLRKKKLRYYEYPIGLVMKEYLIGHQRKDAVCFLCKKHHLKLDSIKTKKGLKEYKKNINSL